MTEDNMPREPIAWEPVLLRVTHYIGQSRLNVFSDLFPSQERKKKNKKDKDEIER
jgi:hypothetical protein